MNNNKCPHCGRDLLIYKQSEHEFLRFWPFCVILSHETIPTSNSISSTDDYICKYAEEREILSNRARSIDKEIMGDEDFVVRVGDEVLVEKDGKLKIENFRGWK